MVNTRLDIQHSHILAAGRSNSLKIHSATNSQKYKQVNIVFASKPSQDVKEATNDFFSRHIIKGLSKMVSHTATTVRENNSVGEYEASEKFSVWEDNKFFCCETYCYRWNFAIKVVIEDVEDVLGVLLLKRVFCLTMVNPQVLVWAISRQAKILGKENEAREMIDKAMTVLDEVVTYEEATVQKFEVVQVNTNSYVKSCRVGPRIIKIVAHREKSIEEGRERKANDVDREQVKANNGDKGEEKGKTNYGERNVTVNDEYSGGEENGKDSGTRDEGQEEARKRLWRMGSPIYF